MAVEQAAASSSRTWRSTCDRRGRPSGPGTVTSTFSYPNTWRSLLDARYEERLEVILRHQPAIEQSRADHIYRCEKCGLLLGPVEHAALIHMSPDGDGPAHTSCIPYGSYRALWEEHPLTLVTLKPVEPQPVNAEQTAHEPSSLLARLRSLLSSLLRPEYRASPVVRTTRPCPRVPHERRRSRTADWRVPGPDAGRFGAEVVRRLVRG